MRLELRVSSATTDSGLHPSDPDLSLRRQILRLLFTVFFAAHFFACVFWAVARNYRTPDELDALLADKNAPADVSLFREGCVESSTVRVMEQLQLQASHWNNGQQQSPIKCR